MSEENKKAIEAYNTIVEHCKQTKSCKMCALYSSTGCKCIAYSTPDTFEKIEVKE